MYSDFCGFNNVLVMLLQSRSPSFNTILHKSRVRFKPRLRSSDKNLVNLCAVSFAVSDDQVG